jgi:hypothetical protein
MDSDNPIGADNQQETKLRALEPLWVVGFVDGEGCFSVSIHRNESARPTGGWHVQPTFQVSQHQDHTDILEDFVRFFGCGKVRAKGKNSQVDVFVVHSSKNLVDRVIPFFERHELRVKRDDFESFAFITRAIRTRSHHRPDVFTEVVERAYSMNARGKQRKRPSADILGSSETTREVLLGG